MIRVGSLCIFKLDFRNSDRSIRVGSLTGKVKAHKTTLSFASNMAAKHMRSQDSGGVLAHIVVKIKQPTALLLLKSMHNLVCVTSNSYP